MMAAQSACPEGMVISVGLDVFRMGARVLVSTWLGGANLGHRGI